MVHPPRGAKWTGGRVRARRRKTSSARIDASRVDSDATREPPASLAYRRSTRSSSAAASVPREANMPRQLPSRGLPLPSLGSFNADIFAPANRIFFHDCLPIRPIFRVEEICAPRAHWTRVPIPPKQGRRRKSPRVAGSRPTRRSDNAMIRRAGGRKRRASRWVGSAGAAFRGARGTVVAVGRSVAEARRRACSRAVVPWSFPRSRASGDPVGARASPPRRRAPSGMSGIPSVAEAQRAYAAYQQYHELDKQYGITDKAVAGTNPRARPPTNPTRPPPPRRPPSASPGPARTETIIGCPRVPDEVPPSLPLLRVRSRASPLSPQPNKPPMTSSVVSPPP